MNLDAYSTGPPHATGCSAELVSSISEIGQAKLRESSTDAEKWNASFCRWLGQDLDDAAATALLIVIKKAKLKRSLTAHLHLAPLKSGANARQ